MPKKDEYLFGGVVGGAKWLKEKLKKKKKKTEASKFHKKKQAAKKDSEMKSKAEKWAKGKQKKAAKKEAANKSWSKATKSAKKSGVKLTDLVKQRKGLKKGTAEYAKVQNQINKHYGVKKVHKAPEKKEVKPKPTAREEYEKHQAEKKDVYGRGEEKKIKEEMSQSMEQGGMVNRPQYGSGGKVEGGGLFDFPTSNARDRNK